MPPSALLGREGFARPKNAKTRAKGAGFATV